MLFLAEPEIFFCMEAKVVEAWAAKDADQPRGIFFWGALFTPLLLLFHALCCVPSFSPFFLYFCFPAWFSPLLP